MLSSKLRTKKSVYDIVDYKHAHCYNKSNKTKKKIKTNVNKMKPMHQCVCVFRPEEKDKEKKGKTYMKNIKCAVANVLLPIHHLYDSISKKKFRLQMVYALELKNLPHSKSFINRKLEVN